MSSKKRIVYVFIITARQKKDVILELLTQQEAQLINTVYAKGSIKANSLLSAFGLVADECKVISTCLLPVERADRLIELLNTEYDFMMPNTGIAFTIPVEGLSY